MSDELFKTEYEKIANAVGAPTDATADVVLEELQEHFEYMTKDAVYHDLINLLDDNHEAIDVVKKYFDDLLIVDNQDSEETEEPYQIKPDDKFTFELAVALAQNGDTVRNVSTGTVLTIDDCKHDSLWQLDEEPKSEHLADNEIKAIDRTKVGLDFGQAIIDMKNGKRVARVGWNGKGMFLYYVPANKYLASRNEHGTMVGVFEDDMVPYGAYIAMKTAQNNVVPWLASQTDVLADDWVIVE